LKSPLRDLPGMHFSVEIRCKDISAGTLKPRKQTDAGFLSTFYLNIKSLQV